MKTKHKIYFSSSEKLSQIGDESVDLILTSPPYPMIEMWDETFGRWDPLIEDRLRKFDGKAAFELMNEKLNLVWLECMRVLKTGGVACINVGDATRRIGNQFKLYSNHTEITQKFADLGFDCLPIILWRKQTNAPNKFMGSGMLPSGGYVTLEHEYILLFRKGNKREFKLTEKINRQESAFFWEERNSWFSDLWDFKGTNQLLGDAQSRKRSAAYPLELAHRAINMYSMKGDIVLDPFMGTGTTLRACVLNNRNCIGFEIDEKLRAVIFENTVKFSKRVNELVFRRLKKHIDFIAENENRKGHYINRHYNFPVVTRQEQNLKFEKLTSLKVLGHDEIECEYSTFESSDMR